MSSWFVYIVRCSDKTLYTGVTTDVEERLKKHNAGTGAKYTRSRRPVVLAYIEKKRSESTAKKREAQIKRLSRNEKVSLIKTKARPIRLPKGLKTPNI
jgi:putative endonuclease